MLALDANIGGDCFGESEEHKRMVDEVWREIEKPAEIARGQDPRATTI